MLPRAVIEIECRGFVVTSKGVYDKSLLVLHGDCFAGVVGMVAVRMNVSHHDNCHYDVLLICLLHNYITRASMGMGAPEEEVLFSVVPDRVHSSCLGWYYYLYAQHVTTNSSV